MQSRFLASEFCLPTPPKNQPYAQYAPRTLPEMVLSTHHGHLYFYCFLSPPTPPTLHSGGAGGGGNKIVMETVVKAKVGKLEEEAREVYSRQLRNDLTGVVQ